VATGLRNPVGLAFHPTTGALWTSVNERDWRAGGAPPDYVTAVPGGAAFGWPDCYALDGAFRRDPELPEPRACRDLTRPTVELPPHSAPLGMAFHRDTLVVALHGSRPELPEAGYKLVRVRWDDRGRARVDDFATGWRDGPRVWGRPVDVVAAGDALYVSDDHGGRVVRITRTP
jgi:glucose/arabinose dehydrogenase